MKFWEAMKAMEEGNEIEWKWPDGSLWHELEKGKYILSDWEFRLKPKPKPKLWQVVKHWEEGGRIQGRDLWGESDWRDPAGGWIRVDLVRDETHYEFRIHPDEELSDA